MRGMSSERGQRNRVPKDVLSKRAPQPRYHHPLSPHGVFPTPLSCSLGTCPQSPAYPSRSINHQIGELPKFFYPKFLDMAPPDQYLDQMV